MKKKIGDLNLREIKKNCKQDKYECSICDYCKLKELCFHKVFELLNSLDKEIEVEDNETQNQKEDIRVSWILCR